MPEVAQEQVVAPLVQAAMDEIFNAFGENELRHIAFDEEDLEDDEDEEAHIVAMENWRDLARHNIANGLDVPIAPEDGPILLVVNEVEYIWDNDQGLERMDEEAAPNPNLIMPDPFLLPPPRPRRGNRAVLDGDRHIPAGFNAPPPQMKRHIPPPKFRNVKAQKEYPLYGVHYNGYLFSRDLDFNEKILLGAYGYHELLKKVPDLVYKEKEIPIDENEECVILLPELADHLAIQACKQFIPDFSVETHTTQYQVVYKRYLKEISAFKRTKNG